MKDLKLLLTIALEEKAPKLATTLTARISIHFELALAGSRQRNRQQLKEVIGKRPSGRAKELIEGVKVGNKDICGYLSTILTINQN